MNPKIVWISIIVTLLAIPCIFYGIMLVFVVVHPVSFVPNYEQKAANWDQFRREQQRSDQLGWKLDLQAAPTEQPYQFEVTLRLSDSSDEPIVDASVEIEALHTAYAAKVFQRSMQSTPEETYRATLPGRRSGMWEFRVTATRGDALFFQTVQKIVVQPARR